MSLELLRNEPISSACCLQTDSLPVYFNVAVEGASDIPIAERLLAESGHHVHAIYDQRGKGRLDRNLHRYNTAARFSNWLVLRDLDHDAPCAGAMAGQLLPDRSERMYFRIAVREVESWLLADRQSIARSLSVRIGLVPEDPESVDDPKAEIVRLARSSRSRATREDLVPAPGTSAPVGPGYLSWVAEYASTKWRPSVAADRSRSLARCMAALRGAAAE